MSLTQYDVAKKAGVSHMTVSNVLNNVSTVSRENREKVLAAIRETGYVPNETARRFRLKGARSKTFNIGIVTPQFLSAEKNPTALAIIDGVTRAAADNGYHLYFNYPADYLQANHSLFMRMINPEIIDGVLFIGARKPEAAFIETVRVKIPNIGGISTNDIKNMDTLNSDLETAGYEATSYLARLGHRRIGMLGVHENTDPRPRGYKKAMYELNLAVEPAYLQGPKDPDSLGEPYSIKSGHRWMTEILERAQVLPTALYAQSDQLALGAMNALKERGLRIPDDISVIGFDDIAESAEYEPALTTFRVPRAEMGAAAVKRLLERIDNPGLLPVSTVYPVQLVERGSCRKIV